MKIIENKYVYLKKGEELEICEGGLDDICKIIILSKPYIKANKLIWKFISNKIIVIKIVVLRSTYTEGMLQKIYLVSRNDMRDSPRQWRWYKGFTYSWDVTRDLLVGMIWDMGWYERFSRDDIFK